MPPDSLPLATQLMYAASHYLKLDQHAAAETLLRESLTIREKLAPDAWSTFNTQSTLGEALLGQKKHADAEPLLIKGYEGMKQRAAKVPPQVKVLRLREALENSDSQQM